MFTSKFITLMCGLQTKNQLKGLQKVQWNAEGLPAGMYYFRISDYTGRIGSGKLLKY